MKTLKILFLFATVVAFSSCQKVIDLKLDNSEPRLVISGGISDVDSIPVIKITQTVDYNQPNNFPEIQDAIIIVTDNLGSIDTFTPRSRGGYRGHTLGVPGRTYTLTILNDGKEYKSVTKMAKPISIDSVTLEALSLFGGEFPFLQTYWQDPKGEKNYYYLDYLINGVPSGDYSFLSDDLRDGEQMVIGTISDDYKDVKIGDTITVQLQCIDAGMYEYYRTLEALLQAGGGFGASTPDNPIPNITGDVLGYFKVFSVTEKDFIIQ